MRIGCAAACGDIPLVSACGYDYIELPGRWVCTLSRNELKHLKVRLQDAGIACEGLNAYCPPEIVIVGEGFRLPNAVAYAQRCADVGAELGIRLVGIGSPASRKVAAGYDPREAFDQMACFFAATADVFLPYGIQVGIEPLGRCYTPVLNTLEEAWALDQVCNRMNLGLVADFYNLEQNSSLPISLEPFTKRIIHAHISDDAGNPYRRWFLDERRAQVHQSRIQRLIACGYGGSLSVEVDLPLQRHPAQHTLHILRQAARECTVNKREE